MKFKILHEIKGRIRIHLAQKQMTFQEADVLQYYLTSQDNIVSVKIYERNQDVTICYTGKREHIIQTLQQFCYDSVSVPEHVLENSGRQMNREYWDKLVQK